MGHTTCPVASSFNPKRAESCSCSTSTTLPGRVTFSNRTNLSSRTGLPNSILSSLCLVSASSLPQPWMALAPKDSAISATSRTSPARLVAGTTRSANCSPSSEAARLSNKTRPAVQKDTDTKMPEGRCKSCAMPRSIACKSSGCCNASRVPLSNTTAATPGPRPTSSNLRQSATSHRTRASPACRARKPSMSEGTASRSNSRPPSRSFNISTPHVLLPQPTSTTMGPSGPAATAAHARCGARASRIESKATCHSIVVSACAACHVPQYAAPLMSPAPSPAAPPEVL
mmetsp:Transcript_166186/g.533469  ORF Transcript_166186/g.533469 Transcript_166186/m.533469 type:complete len:286 (+) Transcript_166186:598-1455(+)